MRLSRIRSNRKPTCISIAPLLLHSMVIPSRIKLPPQLLMTASELENLLRTHFSPTHLEVIDESHLHANHRAAKEHGGSHLRVTMVSERFAGMSRLERHRQIHELLGPAMQSIHALQ